jgi:L-fuconolactonase
MNPPVIDTHAHLWHLDRDDYSWLAAPRWEAIRRDFGVADLRATLAPLGIDGAVLVQALQSDAETDWLLDVADASPEVLGVVGWAALSDPQRLRRRLEALSGRAAFRGIRHLVGWPREGDLLARPHALAAFRVVAELGLVAEVMPARLSDVHDVVNVARHVPELVLVVDHLAKPALDGGDRDEWAAAMTAAAREPNVATKLSGWTTPPGPQATAARLRPFVEHAVEVFGPDRLLYASNWPVTLVAGGYDWMWEETLETLRSLSPQEQRAVLGGSAQRLYRLEVAGPGVPSG